MRRSRHWPARTPISISTMFSQLACLGSLVLSDPDLIRLRLMPWRLASACGDSPPRNSWTTCRLNSTECVRCLAMGFLLESPVQLADSQVPYLSTRRGALHLASNIHSMSGAYAQRRFKNPFVPIRLLRVSILQLRRGDF